MRALFFIFFVLLFAWNIQGTQVNCTYHRYPVVVGGNNGDTYIQAFDRDSFDFLAIGGISYDTSFVGSMAVANNFKPFIGYFARC